MGNKQKHAGPPETAQPVAKPKLEILPDEETAAGLIADNPTDTDVEYAGVHSTLSQSATSWERPTAAPNIPPDFERRTLPAPLAFDHIFDPEGTPQAETWDCLESLQDQLRMDEPLSRSFRERVGNQLPSVSDKRVRSASRFRLVHWLMEEAERQAQREVAAPEVAA